MSSNQPACKTPAEVARVLQIIVGAMCSSVAIFLAFLLIFNKPQAPPPAPAPERLLSLIAAGLSVGAVAMSLIVPAIIERQGVHKAAGQAPALLQAYIVRTVVACGILEGAAILNTLALCLEHQLWTVAIVLGLLFLLALQFPTVDRISQWLETVNLDQGQH